jgi:hypothetical protein
MPNCLCRPNGSTSFRAQVLPIGIGRWQGTERQNRTCNICDKNEIGGVLQCPSHHDDRRRRLLNSTYLTRVNVSKFDNLFQSRNKIKIRHLCKFIKIIFSKTHLSFFVVFLLCYIHPLVMCTCMPNCLCRPNGSTSFRAQVRGFIQHMPTF